MNRLKILSVIGIIPLLVACAAPGYQSSGSTGQPAASSQTVAGVQTAPPASAVEPTVKTVSDAKLGTILIDAKGMTLYRFTNDAPNVSNCYDQCAQNWPPLLVNSGSPLLAGGVAGELGTITRKDGTHQVTYNGMPLYYRVTDSKPGETTGQGVGSIWYVVQPASTQPAGGTHPYY